MWFCLMLVLIARVVVHAVFVQFSYPVFCSKRYTLYIKGSGAETQLASAKDHGSMGTHERLDR